MMATGAYDVRAEATSWWWWCRRRLVQRLLDHHVRGNRLHILDVGCGAGGAFSLLQRYGSVAGLDSDRQAVRLARRTGRPVLQGDITQPGDLFPLGSFDLITALDLLEHIQHDTLALWRMWRLLAPGGLLLLTVPAMPSLWSPHDVRLGHVRRYTAAGLALSVETAGFTLAFLSHYGISVLPLQYLVRRRLPSVNGGPLPGPLDWALRSLVSLEILALPALRAPIGPTLVAVARKEA